MEDFKKLCSFFVLLLTVIGTCLVSASAKETSLSRVKTYKIYYGSPTPKIIQEMKNYNLVIIEPHLYTKEQVLEIQAKGTKVFGYISIMELPTWNQERMLRVEETDFLYRDQKKIYYVKWDSYLMDISSKHYQSLLKDEITGQIIDKSFDGILLDTVGDIDDEFYNDPDSLQTQRNGLVRFLKDLKHEQPNISLLQNWGFGTLMNHTAPYVDGIMWENFNYRVVANDQWSLNWIRQLKSLHRQFNLDVFTVSNDSDQKSVAFSKQQGFIPVQEADYMNWSSTKK